MSTRREFRLTVRISAEADDALTLLAQDRGMTRCQVIESLLTGDPLDHFARREGLSADELRYVRAMQ